MIGPFWCSWSSGLWLATIFFFSSRRRHTRSTRDWSSDVCSSDLAPGFRWYARRSRPRTPGRRCTAARSEERRVGKECRSRGAPEHYKKKWSYTRYAEGSAVHSLRLSTVPLEIIVRHIERMWHRAC